VVPGTDALLLLTLYEMPEKNSIFIFEQQNMLLLPKAVQLRSLEIVLQEIKNRKIIFEGLGIV
jgi:hypothetical protein